MTHKKLVETLDEIEDIIKNKSAYKTKAMSVLKDLYFEGFERGREKTFDEVLENMRTLKNEK